VEAVDLRSRSLMAMNARGEAAGPVSGGCIEDENGVPRGA